MTDEERQAQIERQMAHQYRCLALAVLHDAAKHYPPDVRERMEPVFQKWADRGAVESVAETRRHLDRNGLTL
jgi:hypothetical protein